MIPSRVVAVEGIPVFRKAALFAGRRRNEGLGRSVCSCGYPPATPGAPMTADVRRTPRRGTPSACAYQAHAPDAGTRDRRMRTGTRPSLGPSTRARRSSLCSAAQASEVGRRRGHHGWANSRKREEPALGPSSSDVARLAVCHRSRKGESVAHQKREEIEVSAPARIVEPGFGCPHVVLQLQKSIGDVWPRISSANALQKERSGSSERGPSSERKSAGETVGGRVERRDESRVGLTAQVGRGSAQDPG